MVCVACFADIPYVRSSKRFCGAACKQVWHRRRQYLRSQGLTDTPVCHLGQFQDYQERYAGKVDVLITDPPYARATLPLYDELATFARTVLRPGGWLLCLTGWGIDLEIRQYFNAVGLEFVTVCCYHMPSARSKAEKRLSTGKKDWQEHHKPLLWYQQPGQPHHKRWGGGTDTMRGSTTPLMNQDARPWEQDLAAFQAIVSTFTKGPDVILDPMMGWGTTLHAAVSLDRTRVIGIELLPERYAYACQRLGLAPVHAPAADEAAD